MSGFDLITFGEVLIDFTNNGYSNQGNILFEANPGGSVTNAIAMAAKLGRNCAYIGKVGDDFLGRLLENTLKECGINTDNLGFHKDIPTTLAFVHTKEGGDRDFSFYRKPGADIMLRKEDIPVEIIKNAGFIHYASLSMTDEELFAATEFAIKSAEESNVPISFDPNYRPPLWSSSDYAKKRMWYGVKHCDLLKISDDEIEFLTGTTDIDKGIEIIREKSGAKLICATLGAKGSIGYYKDLRVEAPPFILPDTIETTGAGDTFTGCMIDALLTYGFAGLNEEVLRDRLTFANAAAALITTKKGALRLMPGKEEIEALINK